MWLYTHTYLAIIHAGPPSAPYNLTVVTYNYTTETFTIELTWMAEDIYTYKIHVHVSVNTTYNINTIMTTYELKGQYNIPVNFNVSAISCAGASENATQEVFQGTNDVYTHTHAARGVDMLNVTHLHIHVQCTCMTLCMYVYNNSLMHRGIYTTAVIGNLCFVVTHIAI